ncbi:MAG: VPA1262 family N-terminal domain-containing protein, partial [Cyclobacteriaceae bacterium]
TRLINQDIIKVVDQYKNAENGMDLLYESLNAHISVPYLISQEPSGFNPLLIKSNEEKTIGRILPKRNTSFRVWSKLNTDKKWLKDYSDKVFDKIGDISRQNLGFDLSAIPEHIGNIYLFGCNPILRKWGSKLIDREKELFLSFHEREGHTIVGCELVLEEERSKNTGFTLRKEITSRREKVELPYFPHAVHTKIYDQSGNLIERSFGTWINFQFNMSIQESVMNLEVKGGKGTEVVSIPKYSRVATNTVGDYDLSTARYLRSALDERRFEELESNKEFIFFPNAENSKVKAQSTVRELLNMAGSRCMILDPYFQASDLVYAFIIRNISIPIQIISSASFLKEEIKIREVQKKLLRRFYRWMVSIFRKPKKGQTQGQALLDGIESYQKLYSQQKIECKVLRGKKSPLHDRYIVIDNDVYLLGSSLNEFGSRATTIIKVPTPKPMIEQALKWWEDEEICLSLKSYNNKPDE